VHPGAVFADSSSAAFDIATLIGGNLFGAVFLAGLVVAQFASGLSAQASVARLLFAMGRDSVLPKKLFAYVHPRFHTPAFGIAASGVVGLGALAMSVSTSTSFINFGAFTAFTFVNLSVIARYLRSRGERPPVLGHVVVPAIGAAIDIWLLTSLDGTAITLGMVWLGLGVAYLAVLTRGFRVPPPEMQFAEEEPASA
jgi:amino acid transporter